jgi:hypothetical protein
MFSYYENKDKDAQYFFTDIFRRILMSYVSYIATIQV